MKTFLCDLVIISNARKNAGEWTFTPETTPVQIPYDVAQAGGRHILPFLRDLKVLPRKDSNVKCVPSMRNGFLYFIVNKSGERPLLAVTKPIKEIETEIEDGKRILPETCTKPFPIDINLLKPGRKKYVNFLKIERRKREVEDFRQTITILEKYEKMLETFYRTLEKMTFPEIQKKTGIKEWRARAMLYDKREPTFREVANVLSYAEKPTE